MATNDVSTEAMTIQEIIDWTRDHGTVGSVDRLKMMLLPDLVREGVQLDDSTDATCSDSLLARILQTAETVVGKSSGR